MILVSFFYQICHVPLKTFLSFRNGKLFDIHFYYAYGYLFTDFIVSLFEYSNTA